MLVRAGTLPRGRTDRAGQYARLRARGRLDELVLPVTAAAPGTAAERAVARVILLAIMRTVVTGPGPQLGDRYPVAMVCPAASLTRLGAAAVPAGAVWQIVRR